MATALHRRYQLAELSRYLKSPEADANFNFMPALSHAAKILMRSENISAAKIEAITPVHRRHWGKFFPEVEVIPIENIADEEFKPRVFHATASALGALATGSFANH